MLSTLFLLIQIMQRKCWWDGVEVDVKRTDGVVTPVKLWARRVWTLELSLVSAVIINVVRGGNKVLR